MTATAADLYALDPDQPRTRSARSATARAATARSAAARAAAARTADQRTGSARTGDVRDGPDVRDRPDVRPRDAEAAIQWSLPLVEGSLAVALDAAAPPWRSPRPHLTLVEHPDRELEQRAAQFVQALLEVVAGTRPMQQLVRVLRPDVYEELHHRMLVLARTRTRGPQPVMAGRVASIRIHRVRPDAAEVAARVVADGRSRAIAARLELDTDRRDPTWVCVALCWV